MLKDEHTATELEPWIRLHRLAGIGLLGKHALLRRYGTPDGVLGSDDPAVVKPDLFRKACVKLESAIETDLLWAERPGHGILAFSDPRYPEVLKQIADPPLLLYVRGIIDVLNSSQVAIVGSRNATPYGRHVAAAIASGLAACQVTTTSGLALGIDAAAHQGAINGNGVTIAVAAHGLGEVYPRRHRRLAERICGSGAMVSEFPLGFAPRPAHFPRRNRLISGLSLGTVVVEANRRSGSLITARCAAEQNREVFAIPGPVHSPQSHGCHDLIRQGAKLVESLEHILEEIPAIRQPGPAETEGSEPDRSEFNCLLEFMGYEPVTVDVLVARSGLTAEEVSSMLLRMEVNGCVVSCPGGEYLQVPKNSIEKA